MYKTKELSLCFVQKYIPSEHSHASGLGVYLPTFDASYNGRQVASIDDISQAVHLVPDFSAPGICVGHYTRYLLNHDVYRHAWSYGQGTLPVIREDDLVT